MKNIKKRILLPLLSALCLGVIPAGAVDFLPVSEVREGMKGYAKTVVHGTEMSTFDVEVLGVMKNKGATGGDLVLVRVSGPVIDESHGIAQGMSGSPVYIDGKLLGAVAYGFPQSEGRIGMVTPISDMLDLWTLEDKRLPTLLPRPSDDLIPLATPLMASGYSEDALRYMSEKLSDFRMEPIASAVADSDEAAPRPLEPGSAVAASMVTGDLKLGAVGTVTYVDENRMVAFGHPFMNKGTTDYFMHNSYIFTVIPSRNIPFKLGSVGAEIGMVDQDRGAGIAGVAGKTPDFTALHAYVKDRDTGSERNLNVRMIRDEALIPTLAATSVYNAVSNALDRRGEGSVELTYTLHPEDPKQKPFTRSNLYWSKTDVAERSVDELYNVVKILEQNRFEKYPLRGIEVDMDVTKDRRTAQLLDATASPMIVSPGDTISIRARLQPFRGEIFYKDLLFKVPEDQPYGEMILEVRGGGVVPLPYLIQQQKYNLTDEIRERLRTYKDFNDLHDKIQGEDRNNEIVAEILDPEVSMIAKGEDEGAGDVKIQDKKAPENPEYLKKKEGDADTAKNKDEGVARAETEYVIYGDGQFTFRVTSPAERDKELAKLAKSKKKLLLELVNKEKEELEEKVEETPENPKKDEPGKEKDKTGENKAEK